MDTSEIWSVDEKVRFRRVLDEAVVIHQEVAEALVVNEVGITFLELCDGKRTIGDILQRLASRYDASMETLHSDLESYIQELSESGVIHRHGSSI